MHPDEHDGTNSMIMCQLNRWLLASFPPYRKSESSTDYRHRKPSFSSWTEAGQSLLLLKIRILIWYAKSIEERPRNREKSAFFVIKRDFFASWEMKRTWDLWTPERNLRADLISVVMMAIVLFSTCWFCAGFAATWWPAGSKPPTSPPCYCTWSHKELEIAEITMVRHKQCPTYMWKMHHRKRLLRVLCLLYRAHSLCGLLPLTSPWWQYSQH